MTSADHSTFELGEARLKIRDNLEFKLQRFGDRECYLIEDEANSQFYRIGVAEYAFISLLDGKTPIREVVAKTSSALGANAFSEQSAAAICKWLIDCGLASTPESSTASRLHGAVEEKERKKIYQWLNPISLRIPLGNPDQLASALTLRIGWIFSPAFALVWLLVCLWGLYAVAANWSELTRGGQSVFTQFNAVWLAATWVVLKGIHELAHAVACKRFGGHVREFGLVLILLIPLPYVDVTSAWRFQSKLHRILTSAAGMLAELFLAAAAAIIWSYADVGGLRQHALNVMITGSLVTVLFNANPLMRFDGYYILADLLELPNLATHGNQLLRSWGNKLFFGAGKSRPKWPEGKAWIVRIYAVAAFAWRILICVGLTLAASSLLSGVGLIFASLAIVLWFGVPLWQLAHYLAWGTPTDSPNRVRFALASLMIFGGGSLALAWIPGPGSVTAPLVIEYEPLTVVRNKSPGFVASILVEPGQLVTAGELLVLLENRELVREYADVQVASALARVRARSYFLNGELAAFQAEQAQLAAMEKQQIELEQLVHGLEVRAPRRGHVVARDLHERLNTYLTVGEQLLVIGNEQRKEGQALVAQHELDAVQHAAGSDVSVYVWGQGSHPWRGRIRRFHPRATRQLPHAALAASNGGPLAVQHAQSTPNGADLRQPEWELIEPRIAVYVALEPTAAEHLRAGQLGFLRFAAERESLGAYLQHSIDRWIRARVRETHGL